MNKSSLTDWLKHIESFHADEIELGLQRIKQVAEKLQLLKFAGKTLLVAGTNGKGSCVAMLEALALNRGKSVICYTSPHLLSFNERLRVDGKDIDDESLIHAFAHIEKHRENIPLTFFEFTTLAALLIAQQIQPEILVLEVGLGGRLDATNIVDADVAIITSIAKDHCQWLGDDLQSIAYEKSGIIRQHKPALIGDPQAFQLIKQARPEYSAQLLLIEPAEEQLNQALLARQVNPYRLVEQNILLARQAFEIITNQTISQQILLESLAHIKISGRFQLLNKNNPCIIADVAHNPRAVENLKQQLEKLIKTQKIAQVTAIFGVMADKSVKQILEIMQPVVNDWCFVDLPMPRAMPAEQLDKLYQSMTSLQQTNLWKSNLQQTAAQVFASVQLAYQSINAQKIQQHLIIVFGSFITVAEMLKCINKNTQPNQITLNHLTGAQQVGK